MTTSDTAKAAASPICEALQRLHARLQKHPDDGRLLDEAAVLHYQAGQLADAVACARRAAAVLARDPIVHDHLGLILLAADLPAEAVVAAKRAVALAPRQGSFWLNLGNAHLAIKEVGAAIVALENATRLLPREPLAWFNLGNALARQDRLPAAIAALRKAVALDPKSALARRNTALLLRQAGRPAEAATMLVPLVPARDPRVLHLLGNLYLESGDRAAALEPLRIAAHLRPDDTEVQLDLVRCLVHLERKDAAAALCEQLCRRIPENPLLWNLRGLCTPALQEAAAWFRRALALQPGYADAAVYLARRLVDDTRAAEALPVLDAALALNPQHPELHYTRGVALIELDRAREALAANSAAIALQPDHANAQWNRALCHLRLGEFSAGWAGYDWRWHHDTKELRRYAAIPEWPADRPRSGRLLVWSEQGVGDEVMFATLLPHLAGKVDEVVVACCPRLVPLFARSFPSFTIVPQDPDRRVPDPEIQADWQIPAGALPARLWTPAGHPGGGRTVLAADPRLTSQLRARYHATGRPAVGIAWRTNNSRNGAARTISPTQWAPHLRSLPARLVSLQYGDTKSDLDAAAAAGVEIFQDAEVDQLRNLDAFAAQIAAVDAIITIDNSTVHFAGALGCPTILLLPTPADWRWLSEGATTTWYKSVGIQRRAFEEGWDAPLNRALADILATITPGGTSTSPDSK